MSKTVIRVCTCENKGQDQLHGKGNRVHNEVRTNENARDQFACTVCGTERP